MTATSSERTNLWETALPLSLVALLTRVTTFVVQVVIANRFGANYQADAYFMVENILLMLGDFIVVGFGVTFIPLWMEYRIQHGEQDAEPDAIFYAS